MAAAHLIVGIVSLGLGLALIGLRHRVHEARRRRNPTASAAEPMLVLVLGAALALNGVLQTALAMAR